VRSNSDLCSLIPISESLDFADRFENGDAGVLEQANGSDARCSVEQATGVVIFVDAAQCENRNACRLTRLFQSQEADGVPILCFRGSEKYGPECHEAGPVFLSRGNLVRRMSGHCDQKILPRQSVMNLFDRDRALA